MRRKYRLAIFHALLFHSTTFVHQQSFFCFNSICGRERSIKEIFLRRKTEVDWVRDVSLIWVAGVTREGRGSLRGGTEKVGGDGVDWWAFRFWVTRTCHSVRCSTTFCWRLWGFVNKNFLTRIQNLPEYTPRTKGKRLIFPGKRISCMSVFPVFIYLQLDSTQQEMLDLIL